jgi:hypothetical protein
MIGRWLRIGWKKNLVVGQINTCQFGGRGRLVLINFVLINLTMLVLTFFKVPKGVLEK